MRAQVRTSIQSLQFDTSGWTVEQETPDVIKWTNDKSQFLSLHFFAKKPDIPCALERMDTLRAAYRQGLSQSSGALISADRVVNNGLECVQLIFKTPRQPHGMVYVGSLTFPFADCSYVAKIQCAEFGTSGVRDSFVLDAMLKDGSVSVNPITKEIEGWSADPYDPQFTAPLLRNRSDDRQYDAQFPDHPLTAVRQILTGILRSVGADDALMAADKFRGPMPGQAGFPQSQPMQAQQPTMERFQQPQPQINALREQSSMRSDRRGMEPPDRGDSADDDSKKQWWKFWKK
jgi:hypothetical protein